MAPQKYVFMLYILVIGTVKFSKSDDEVLAELQNSKSFSHILYVNDSNNVIQLSYTGLGMKIGYFNRKCVV